MNFNTALNVLSVLLSTSIGAQATGRDFVESSFYGRKLRNGMDSNLCLTYNFNNGGLTVKTCQDAPGFPEAQQGWDFFDGRLHPESDVCLKSKSNEYVGNYDSLVMVKGGSSCSNFQTTSNGKIYTTYSDGARMYVGVSGSCNLADIEDRKVELQRFNFRTYHSCGKAQQWYLD